MIVFRLVLNSRARTETGCACHLGRVAHAAECMACPTNARSVACPEPLWTRTIFLTSPGRCAPKGGGVHQRLPASGTRPHLPLSVLHAREDQARGCRHPWVGVGVLPFARLLHKLRPNQMPSRAASATSAKKMF